MDLMGITILGLTTGVGGGIIRDIIIGQTPPLTFRDPTYLIISVVVSVIVFTPPVRKWIFSDSMLYEWLMLIMDSVGLGVFTVLVSNQPTLYPQFTELYCSHSLECSPELVVEF